MKRSTKRRTTRWTEKNRPTTPYPEREPVAPTEAAIRESAPRGLGPYEAAYDVSLGYAHERAIVLP